MKKKKKRGLTPLPLMIFYDLLAIGIGLTVFALFHHVLNFQPVSEPVVILTPSPAPTKEPEETEIVVEELEEQLPPGDFSRKYADLFTDGEIISDANSYRSRDLAVNYTRVEQEMLVCHVAEIYVRDVHLLQTGFSSGEYMGNTEFFTGIASGVNAVTALSGDMYKSRWEGVVIRNGVLYRDTEFEDVCVLWPDGVMECIPAGSFDPSALVAGGAWQAWGFGPTLVKNGASIDNSSHSLDKLNPRAAIGYAEPGHYYLVEVEGRTDYSNGMRFDQLSELFLSLGCTEAYNLDGGQSANFYWNGELLNQDFYRKVSDIIYVAESTEGSAE